MAATKNITVDCWNVRAGETGVDGSWDLDVTVTYVAAHGSVAEAVTRSGELTLVSRDGQPVAYGDADHWVSGDLLGELRADLGDEGLRSILGEIEAEAASAIEASGVDRYLSPSDESSS